jgi:hypothetical protein
MDTLILSNIMNTLHLFRFDIIDDRPGSTRGNDSHYVRVSEKRLQEEYEMAINHLTINEENRLKMKVQTLKIEKSRIDELEVKIQKLERKHGKIR